MFSSPLLETIFTLFFIYLLIDILVSSVQEFISQRKQSRGRMLRFAIDEMLNDRKNKNFSYLLYQHPKIDLLRKDQKDLPSYIASDNFAQALIEVIAGESTIVSYTQDPVTLLMTASVIKNPDLFAGFKNGVATLNRSELRRMLEDFIEHAENKDELAAEIGAWYNNYMDRVTGWYKRSLRKMLIAVSLCITILFNLNFLKMASGIYTRSGVRTELRVTDANNQRVIDSVARLQLPLGWKFEAPSERRMFNPKFFFRTAWTEIKNEGFFYTLWGWLISVIILTLGAPFWFDVMKKIVNVRNTGKNPQAK
jgi:hypothetical protein